MVYARAAAFDVAQEVATTALESQGWGYTALLRGQEVDHGLDRIPDKDLRAVAETAAREGCAFTVFHEVDLDS